MLGAIFGDIVGSVYEFDNTSDYNFKMLTEESGPTDDSYMTLAVAKALMETFGKDDETIRQAVVKYMQEIGRKYPDGGYGGRFAGWLLEAEPKPYNSFGNGSGMRVSPAGWLYRTLEETLHAAKVTAEVTHNHPEGIKGAQAIAAAIFLARAGADKDDIMNYVGNEFKYDLLRTLAEIKPDYGFYESCQRSVPEAIIAFYEGENYEDVIRKAVSLGGDSDTIACMAGAIAEAYYGMPEAFKDAALARLTPELRQIALDFRAFYDEHSGQPLEGWQEDVKEAYLPSDPLMKLNPLIEELIDDFYHDPGDEKKVINVFDTILIAMTHEGHVLVPVELPDPEQKTPAPDSPTADKTIRGEDGRLWNLLNLADGEGHLSMPVFTSKKKMIRSGVGDWNTLTLPMEEYFRKVGAMEDVEGIILNPGDKGFFLSRDVLGEFTDQLKDFRAEAHEAGRYANYVVPRSVPFGFSETMAEFVKNNLPEVDKMWLTGIRDEGVESLVLAIKTDAFDPQKIFDRMNTMVSLLNVPAPVSYVVCDDQPWAGAELIYSKARKANSSNN